MSASNGSIRTGRPGELAALVAIDDAASVLYAEAGLHLELPPDHPYVRVERERWSRALADERAFVAVAEDDAPIGFAALDVLDGVPYLDQLSVSPAHMRRGVGRSLLLHAVAFAGAAPLWLTTYDHLPWNRPFYERYGFVCVPDAQCGPALGAELASQRAALPLPERRIAMVRG